jgi:hypothetical protein
MNEREVLLIQRGPDVPGAGYWAPLSGKIKARGIGPERRSRRSAGDHRSVAAQDSNGRRVRWVVGRPENDSQNASYFW